MTRGGARNRSGPQPVEGSRTSERKGLTLTALPPSGYEGAVPDLTQFLLLATDRHERVWAQLWTTPQACAWAEQPWRWPIVADLVKWMVRSDSDDASVSIATAIRQLRDDLGLSQAGLTANGWKIAEPPPVEALPDPVASVTSIKDRLNRGSA